MKIAGKKNQPPPEWYLNAWLLQKKRVNGNNWFGFTDSSQTAFSQRLIPWGVKYTDKDCCEQFVIWLSGMLFRASRKLINEMLKI